MADRGTVAKKIFDVREEMKKNGWWATTAPAWVDAYEYSRVITADNFNEWLQFIFLPNRQMDPEGRKDHPSENYIAPQAVKIFRGDESRNKLLQLLIELDSL